MPGKTQKIRSYLFLIVVIVLGYWQIAFLHSAFKWDFIDVVFPFRFYFSECIQAGFFPFWNPYLQTGTPFFADLQAPTFYPELILTSILGGYGIYTMHLWFVLYLFIAALGMYNLSYHFNKNENASFLAAVAYSFCGYLIGHGQHFFLLVGAAWIPLVLLNYLQLLQNYSRVSVLKTAVFLFLMISGAYQALSFTLMYLLLAVLVYFVVRELKAKNYKAILQMVKSNVFLLLLLVLFTLPLIVATIEVLSEVNRLENGISLKQTIDSAINLKSLISLIVPYSTLHNNDFFGGADLSMRNHYFGLIPLMFFVLALFQKRSLFEYILLAFGALIFASAFSVLPVREFLFTHIPFMNLFKYAAYLRIFGILAFVLLAANYFDYFQKNIEKEQGKLKNVVLAGFMGLVALWVFSGKNISFVEWKANSGFRENVFLQATIQGLVLALFFMLLVFRKKTKYFAQLIVLLCAVEMVFAAQLNLPATVGDSEIKPRYLKHELELLPDNFPIPFDSKIKYNGGSNGLPAPFWRNTAIFTKELSFEAFSSFELDSYNLLDDDFPKLKEAVLNNSLCYFSDSIFPLSEFTDQNIDPEKASKHLYLNDTDYQKLKNTEAAVSSSDQIQVSEFSPQKIRIKTSTKSDRFFTMLQTNYPGWKAFVDDKETPVYTSNFNYRTIVLPKGEHTVSFAYKNNKILFLFLFSNVLFLLVVLVLLGNVLRKNGFSKKHSWLIPGVLLLVVFILAVKVVSAKNGSQTAYEMLSNTWQSKSEVFRRPIDAPVNIGEEDEYYNLQQIAWEELQIKEGTLVMKAKIKSDSPVEALIVSDIPGREKTEWHGAKIEKQFEKTGTWNNIIYQRNFYALKEGEQLRLYLWNNKKYSFDMDSVSVLVYPFK